MYSFHRGHAGVQTLSPVCTNISVKVKLSHRTKVMSRRCITTTFTVCYCAETGIGIFFKRGNAGIDAHYLKFTNISDKPSKHTGSTVRSSVYQSVLLWYCAETDVGVFVQIYTLQTRSCRNSEKFTRQNSPPFRLKSSKGTEPKVRSTVYQCVYSDIVLGLV